MRVSKQTLYAFVSPYTTDENPSLHLEDGNSEEL
jgi:hypothetical protein